MQIPRADVEARCVNVHFNPSGPILRWEVGPEESLKSVGQVGLAYAALNIKKALCQARKARGDTQSPMTSTCMSLHACTHAHT